MRMYQVGAYSVMHGRVKMRQYVSISVIDWLKCLIADELKFDVTYEKKLFVFASKLRSASVSYILNCVQVKYMYLLIWVLQNFKFIQWLDETLQ